MRQTSPLRIVEEVRGSKKRRRRKRKLIPLPRVRAPPKPPKKPWERKTIALRIIVLTHNRANSLQRLLRSLRDAQYGKDERIDLDIWIDKPERKQTPRCGNTECRRKFWGVEVWKETRAFKEGKQRFGLPVDTQLERFFRSRGKVD